MPKVDNTLFIKMFREGRSIPDIAKYFGISPNYAYKVKSKLMGRTKRRQFNEAMNEPEIARDFNHETLTAAERFNEMVMNLTLISRNLVKLHKGQECLKEDGSKYDLDDVEVVELCLKTIQRGENLIKLQNELFKTVYSVQAMEEFMQITLAVIGEFDVEARERVLGELHRRRLARKDADIRGILPGI